MGRDSREIRGHEQGICRRDMKFGAIQKADVATIARVPRDEVKLLWTNDWYDGPISGLAEVNGTKYLFDLIDQDVLGAEDEQRTYWLISLNADQLQVEVGWHELFCRNVGTHFDFTGRPPLPKEQVDMEAFYEPYRGRETPDYSENFVVGWFRL